MQGWLIRNGQLKQSERALHLVDSNGKQRFAPFIANSRFAAKGPFSIAVDPVKIPKGAVSVQWREDGQKDFLDNQSAALAVDGEELRGIVPTKAKVIHLRVRFADATNVALRSIRLETEDGKILQDWNFVE